MGGMARAKKRKQRQRELQNEPVPMLFMPGECDELVGLEQQGMLVASTGCGERRFRRLAEILEQVTRIEFVAAFPWYAIDLYRGKTRIGRLGGGTVGDALHRFACIMSDHRSRIAVRITHASTGDSVMTEPLRARFCEVTLEELHPAPIEIGTGSHIISTFAFKTGVMYCQRFESPEEAMAQHMRNVSLDLPFVGVTHD